MKGGIPSGTWMDTATEDFSPELLLLLLQKVSDPDCEQGDEARGPQNRQAFAPQRGRPQPERQYWLRRHPRRGQRGVCGHFAGSAGVPGRRQPGGRRGQPALALGGPRGARAGGGGPAGARRLQGGPPQQAGGDRLRPGQALQEVRRGEALGGQPLLPGTHGLKPGSDVLSSGR